MILNVIWLLSFYFAMITSGIVVPFIGTLNAFVIVKIAQIGQVKLTKRNYSFLFSVGLSSLLGLIVFYISLYTYKSLVISMIEAIAFWQFIVGKQLISPSRKDKELIADTNHD